MNSLGSPKLKKLAKKNFWIGIAFLFWFTIDIYGQQRSPVYIDQDGDIQQKLDHALQKQYSNNLSHSVSLYQEILQSKKASSILVPFPFPEMHYVLRLERVIQDYNPVGSKIRSSKDSESYIQEIALKSPPLLLSSSMLDKFTHTYQKEGIAGLVKILSSSSNAGLYIGVGEYIRRCWARMEIRETEYPVIKMQAREFYQQALKNSDTENLRHLITNYPVWAYNKDAFISLGDIYFTRGYTDQAIGIWKRLIHLGVSLTEEESTLLYARIGLASLLYGDSVVYQRWKRETISKKRWSKIGKKQMPPIPFFKELEKNISKSKSTGWTHFGGNPAHNTVTEGINLVDKKWLANRYPLPLRFILDTEETILYPVVWEKRIYYNLPGQSLSGFAVCLNWETLEEEWSSELEDQRTKTIPLDNKKKEWNDKPVATAIIEDGRLYLLSPRVSHTNTIHCLEARTGNKIWRFPPLENKSMLFSDPVVSEGKLWTGVTVLSGQINGELFCLDASQGSSAGKLLWKRFLCSSVPFDPTDMQKNSPATSAVALCYGLVYCCTNLGAIAAVDMENGEIQWLAKYHEHFPSKYRLKSNIPSQKRFCSPPIVRHGKVYAMPTDSNHLFVYDAIQGYLLKIIPESQYDSPFQYLLGIGSKGEIFLAGSDIVAAFQSEGNNEILWKTKLPGDTVGRGFLTQKWIYFLSEDCIYQIDTLRGEIRKGMEITLESKDDPHQRKSPIVNFPRSLLFLEYKEKPHLFISGGDIAVFR